MVCPLSSQTQQAKVFCFSQLPSTKQILLVEQEQTISTNSSNPQRECENRRPKGANILDFADLDSCCMLNEAKLTSWLLLFDRLISMFSESLFLITRSIVTFDGLCLFRMIVSLVAEILHIEFIIFS
jgi:hypothetical protein